MREERLIYSLPTFDHVWINIVVVGGVGLIGGGGSCMENVALIGSRQSNSYNYPSPYKASYQKKTSGDAEFNVLS